MHPTPREIAMGISEPMSTSENYRNIPAQTPALQKVGTIKGEVVLPAREGKSMLPQEVPP